MAYNYVASSSQYITFGDVTFLDGLTSISGHSWVNLGAITADAYIFSKYVSGTGIIYLFDDVGSVSGRTDVFTIFIDDGPVTCKIESATGSGTVGAWTSVGWSWTAGSSTGLRMYINGVEDANSPSTTVGMGSFPNNTATFDVGRAAGGGYWEGEIGGCALWDTVLSSDDFAALANYTDPYLVKPQNLLWAPRFIRGALDPITGALGTITGATVSAHHPLIMPIHNANFLTAVGFQPAWAANSTHVI